jgi:hypothetical protein
MPHLTSGRERLAAAPAAAVAIWAAWAAVAAAGDSRAVTGHILVGAAPSASYTVVVNGDGASAVQVHSDTAGILSFDVDDSDLPPGAVSVQIAAGTAPVISMLRVRDITPTSATVTWTTDRPATAQVAYGIPPDLGLLSPLDGTLSTSHSLELGGLAPGTAYRVRALSMSSDGLPATPVEHDFQTLPLAPTGPPTIGGVASRPLTAFFALVTWETDRPATSQVRYGTRGRLDLWTPVDTTRVVSHAVVVGPVIPEVEYGFVALSACGEDTAACDLGHFETPGFLSIQSDAKSPSITRSGAESVVDTSAVVHWATDRPCTTWVEYGRGATLDLARPGNVVSGAVYETLLAGLEPNAVYRYRICALDASGGFAASDPDSFRTAPRRKDEQPGLPEQGAETGAPEDHGAEASLSLSVSPNPVVSDAVVSFTVPQGGHVRVSVFSPAGRLLRVLRDAVMPPGRHVLPWDLTADDGRRVPSGVYLCAVEARGSVATGKLIALR